MDSVNNEIAVMDSTGQIQHELAHIKEHWWGFLLLGALLVLGGATAISYPFITSVSVVMVLGTILLVAGVAIVISAFWTGTWGAFLIHLLSGIMYAVVGLLAMESPIAAAGALTLLVAAAFIIVGVFRLIAAISIRFPQWGWVALNGAITLILGIMVARQFPESSLWLIGILFGVDLVFNGLAAIMLSLSIRNIKLVDLSD